MIESKKSEEIWFCADSDGEKMFKGTEPLRWRDVARIPQDIELWTGNGEVGVDYEVINLPNGFINKLLGLNLSWSDSPVKYTFGKLYIDDCMVEKRKRYDAVKQGLSYSHEDTEAFIKNLMDEESPVLSPTRLLEIISSYLVSKDREFSRGGFIRIDHFRHIATPGKYYACLDKTGKLCQVLVGSNEWKNNVSYVIPRMRVTDLGDILRDINNHKDNE